MFFNNKIKIVNVDGMECKKCADTISDELNRISNVKSVKVNIEKKEVIVKYRNDVDNTEISDSIERVGYTVTGIRDKK